MGTSRNAPSPQIPPWKPALAVLGRPDVTVERQSREIWRAAAADRGELLIRDFSHPALAEACSYLTRGLRVNEAVEAYDNLTLYESGAGLAIDMGRRALSRAIATRGTATDFAAELFAEAVSYYASRDLPSFVGAPGRIRNPSAAIELKEGLRRIARSAATRAGEAPTEPRGWHSYVSSVLDTLKGKEALP